MIRLGVPSRFKQHGRTARSLRFWPCVAITNHHDLTLFTYSQKYNQIHSDYISTIIFRYTYTVISESVFRCSQYTSPFLWTGALQALANELRQDIRSLQSRTVLKDGWWFMIFFRFLCSHSYTDNLMLLKSFLLMVLQTLSISCLNQSKFWNHVVCSDDFRIFRMMLGLDGLNIYSLFLCWLWGHGGAASQTVRDFCQRLIATDL